MLYIKCDVEGCDTTTELGEDQINSPSQVPEGWSIVITVPKTEESPEIPDVRQRRSMGMDQKFAQNYEGDMLGGLGSPPGGRYMPKKRVCCGEHDLPKFKDTERYGVIK